VRPFLFRKTFAVLNLSLTFVLDSSFLGPQSCKSGYTKLISKNSVTNPLCYGSNYCCPSNGGHPLIHTCTWRGHEDSIFNCINAGCLDNEVSVGSDKWGGDTSSTCLCKCSYTLTRRTLKGEVHKNLTIANKSAVGGAINACCQLDAPAPPPGIDCSPYDYCKDFPDQCSTEMDDAFGLVDFPTSLGQHPSLAPTGTNIGPAATNLARSEPTSPATGSKLYKRGQPRTYHSDKGVSSLTSLRYPSRGEYIKIMLRTGGKIIWFGVSNVCSVTKVIWNDGSTTPIPQAQDTEHPLDVSKSLSTAGPVRDLLTRMYLAATNSHALCRVLRNRNSA
jgi:hypothetical protein